ncbi:MAG: phospholipase D-like domain-containing protein [Candidatus Sericytochromatia bacterium]|nr:phospholipase D-like domain-containing protein [Candidatus Sericytochromatia bacterium]
MNRNHVYSWAFVAVLGTSVWGCARPGTLFPLPDGVRGSVSGQSRSPGSTLRVLHVLPEERGTFLVNAVSRAKSSVKLQVYMLTHPGLIDALVKTHRRGVSVQVLLEEKPYNPGNPSAPLPTNRAAYKTLSSAGVPVRWSDPSFRFTHAKAVTVDDVTTYVSTANFTKSGLSTEGRGAREYVIEDRVPPDVAEFSAMFAADWERRAYVPESPDLVVSPTNSREKILSLIASARKEVFVQVEVAGDPEVSTLLAQKVRDGVKVRALLADLRRLQSEDDPALPANTDVARLWRDNGIEVLFQKSPHLHAKAIQVDGGRFYVGSVNLTSNSLNNNRELGVLIDTPDLANKMAQVMNSDYSRGQTVSTVLYNGESLPFFAPPGFIFFR